MKKELMTVPNFFIRHCEGMNSPMRSYSRSNPQNKVTIIWGLLRTDAVHLAWQSALAMTVIIFFLSSCTKNITVDLPDPEEKIVVEGYIENGQTPYVLLTKNSPFFGGFDLNEVDKYLVHDAVVTVSDGIITDTLDEVCFDVTSGNRTFTVCLYVSNSQLIKGELRKSYSLRVEAEGKIITARTSIPDLLEFDSLWYEPHENPDIDSLVFVYARVHDPDTLGNYIRYSTKRNSEDFYYVFVTDDRFINGQTFNFPLRRGQDPDEGFDETTYGYFWKGDTAIIKWAAIDKPSYDFWSTLDYETNSGGPFGSATVIKSNISGGLGIWGGYAANYDTLFIPK